MNRFVPTPDQQRQCERAHQALCGEVNLLGREGMDPRVLLAALATTAADVITSQFGSAHVADWFDGQAKLVRDLQEGS